MKTSRILFLFHSIIFFIISGLFLTSCGEDKTAPNINVQYQSSEKVYYKGDTFRGVVDITDDEEMEKFDVQILLNDNKVFEVGSVTNSSLTVPFEYTFDEDESGEILLIITAEDTNGNDATYRETFEYKSQAVGQLTVNIKLQYQGEPLVMFQDYTYPDGRMIDFTRFSFYAADTKLDNIDIEEISYHNLTNTNAELSGAMTGYNWIINNVPVGQYKKIDFAFGIPPNLNAMTPPEFPSDHPLARTAEHWFNWMSYIFVKVEGNIDLDSNGDKETGVALHLGADEAYRAVSLDRDIEIKSNENTNINIKVDIYDFLGGSENTYDIDSNPQIHRKDQKEPIQTLADNLVNSVR